MASFSNYKGCKLLIRSEQTLTTIAETTVLDYDNTTMTIFVNAQCLEKTNCTKVTLLLFGSGSLHEYKGTIRKQTVYGKREISLYGGQKKEDRTAIRYDLCVPAKIKKLLPMDEQTSLQEPLMVTILNLSTIGALLQCDSPILKVGTSFQLTINIAGKDTVINTVVVRVAQPVPTARDQIQYGCKFLSIS